MILTSFPLTALCSISFALLPPGAPWPRLPRARAWRSLSTGACLCGISSDLLIPLLKCAVLDFQVLKEKNVTKEAEKNEKKLVKKNNTVSFYSL